MSLDTKRRRNRILEKIFFSFFSAICLWEAVFFAWPAKVVASPQGSFLDYTEFRQSASKKTAPLLLPKDQVLRYWRSMEYGAQNFDYPGPIPPRYKGRNHFLFLQADNAGKQILKTKKAYKKDFALLAAQMEFPGEALWWKKIDKRNALERKLALKERRLAQKINELAARGLSALDKIDDIDIEESLPVRLLRAHLYRNRISNLVALHEYELALSFLEELKRMNPVREDWVMHYYFALSLERRLSRWRKDTARSDRELRRLRKRKNFHLLLSVELHFGKNSKEFLETKKMIQHEELGNPRNLKNSFQITK